MLVLTRKTGQRVCVGNDIVFTVLETRKNKVRIGIDAPQHVAVDREEVWQKKNDLFECAKRDLHSIAGRVP